jgi:hypothetical protein
MVVEKFPCGGGDRMLGAVLTQIARGVPDMKTRISLLAALGGLFLPCTLAYSATNLPLGQVTTGTISPPTEVNSYSFSASTGDVMDFTVVVTSGSMSPKIQVLTSTGTPIASQNPTECVGSTIELNTVTLPASTGGDYIVEISDCSTTNTGNYSVYAQRVNNPSGALSLPFAQVTTGSIGSVALSNTYQFSANANDVFDFTVSATSGSLSPRIRLYGPTGALVNSANPTECAGSTVEMNTVTLTASGTYTVLLGDCSDTHTGNYSIYLQRVNNPANPIDLVWGETQSSTIGSTTYSDTYVFSGTGGDVLDFTIAASGSLSPKIRLYTLPGLFSIPLTRPNALDQSPR